MKSVGVIRGLDCDINVYGSLNTPLFLAKEIAIVFGYSANHVNQLLRNVKNRNKFMIMITSPNRHNGGGRGNTNKWFVTEDGIADIIEYSRKPHRVYKFRHILSELDYLRHPEDHYDQYDYDENEEEYDDWDED